MISDTLDTKSIRYAHRLPSAKEFLRWRPESRDSIAGDRKERHPLPKTIITTTRDYSITATEEQPGVLVSELASMRVGMGARVEDDWFSLVRLRTVSEGLTRTG